MRRFVFSIITVIVVLGAAVPAHADRRQAVPRMPQTFHSYGVGFDNLGVVQIANLAIVDRQVDALRAIRFRFLAEQASWNGYYWGVQGPMGWMPITYGDGGWLPGIRPLTPGERVVGAGIAGATVGGIFGGRRGALIGGSAAGGAPSVDRRNGVAGYSGDGAVAPWRGRLDSRWIVSGGPRPGPILGSCRFDK